MKKTIAALTASAILLTLAACGKKEDKPVSDTTTKAQQTTAVVQQTDDKQSAGSNDGTTQNTEDKKPEPTVPGVLYQLNLKDGDEPVVRGLRLDGNLAGLGGDSYGGEGSINGRPCAADKRRSIFELQEWIYIIPDTDKTTGLSVYIVRHNDDPQTYTDSFIAAIADEVPTVALEKPEDDTDTSASWGDIYLSSDNEPGDYDLVITYLMKPVARVRLRFYEENSLTPKSDAELEKLMSDAAASAKGQ